MEVNYLRLKLFLGLLRPFSEWSRKRRMKSFVKLMEVKEGMSILDLGGQPLIWGSVPFNLNLTLLNLPGEIGAKGHDAEPNKAMQTRHNVRYVEGDACNVDGFGNRSFDIVFSNSVIEHVGSPDKQASFAGEVRRLGRSYWVQTPSKWFPVEAHCGMPFWWFYPAKMRRYFIHRWYKNLPGNPWTKMIEETAVLSKDDMRELFPESTVLVETFFGIAKSYIAYRKND